MNSRVFFAPELFIPNGVHDLSFYKKAFGAVELRRFSNADGSIHVSELSIGGALFHLHEVMAAAHSFSRIHTRAPPFVSGFLCRM
ncbi:hypothetical protein LL912_04610 [Niabella sp. CC-SYL272]|uniref:hypothetical protein n=1 Tax=Niabella agricola TaxID=2891571 RepID=UPI001F1F2DBC|nr:hypothetical protein [Niabella agricola]MCF3108054.1 hypothetical protein [Niabella agricola]